MFNIGNRPIIIGPGHPCFTVAGAGVNRNGSMKIARLKLIDAVAQNKPVEPPKFLHDHPGQTSH